MSKMYNYDPTHHPNDHNNLTCVRFINRYGTSMHGSSLLVRAVLPNPRTISNGTKTTISKINPTRFKTWKSACGPSGCYHRFYLWYYGINTSQLTATVQYGVDPMATYGETALRNIYPTASKQILYGVDQ